MWLRLSVAGLIGLYPAAFASDGEARTVKQRCAALLNRSAQRLDRYSILLGIFVSNVLTEARDFRIHYNNLTWNAYLNDPKQAARLKNLETIARDTVRPVLDDAQPGWENDGTELLFVWPSPVSLYAGANGTFPKTFEMGSLLIVKEGLVRAMITWTPGEAPAYTPFDG
jgi:hypothetical protein